MLINKGDGCSIITNLLGYNSFDENQFEFALSFVWNIEFTEKLDVSSIEVIDKWGYLEEGTKSILINSVKDNSHSFKHLESLFYLNNLNIDASIKQKIKNSIETIIIDYFTLIVNLDNQISDFEKEKYEELKRLLQLDYSAVKVDSSNTFSSDDSLEATLKELEELVGLSDIKNEVKSLINFAKVNEIKKGKRIAHRFSFLAFCILWTSRNW